jgi:hypothetical protein
MAGALTQATEGSSYDAHLEFTFLMKITLFSHNGDPDDDTAGSTPRLRAMRQR